MGLFSFFGKDKIENENTRKPFHENRTDDERSDWFSRTRPWHKVSPKVINAIIKKFGDDPMFEVFVITSVEHGLVAEYEEIENTELVNIPEAICARISGILSTKGSEVAQNFNHLFSRSNKTKELQKLYPDALNLLETSIVLSEEMINSYLQLAVLKLSLEKTAEAIEYINGGLSALEGLESQFSGMGMSNINTIANAPQNFKEMKQALLLMKEEIAGTEV